MITLLHMKRRGKDMNRILQRANLIIRENIPYDNKNNLITVFRRGDFLQLNFQTIGCKLSSAGTCTMCNYGHGIEIGLESIMSELYRICTFENMRGINSVLLGAAGSFLDPYEMSENIQIQILRFFSKSSIQNIIIETHYASINESTLSIIRNLLPDKKIEIELGLETVDGNLQENLLNKIIPLDELNAKIKQIHSFNMTVTLNILLGLPFLSARMQLNETRNTIKWALRNKADYVIVFPVNIQPYTLFEWWYHNGYFKQISAWLLVFLLNELTDYEMNHLSISWYGNRTITYEKNRTTIVPCSCLNCQSKLLAFFDDFSLQKNIEYRRQKLKQLLTMKLPCNCREDTLSQIKLQQNDRINYTLKKIIKNTERLVNNNANF